MKKLLALSLTLVVLVALVGCTKPADQKPTPNAPTTAPKTEAPKPAPAPAAPAAAPAEGAAAAPAAPAEGAAAAAPAEGESDFSDFEYGKGGSASGSPGSAGAKKEE